MKCEVCGRSYIAQRKGSHVCSNKCRAKKSRDKAAGNTSTLRSNAAINKKIQVLINKARQEGTGFDWKQIDRLAAQLK